MSTYYMTHLPAIATVFNGNPIRTVVKEDGNLLFVAVDIAKVLGYRDAGNMVRMLDDDELGIPAANENGSLGLHFWRENAETGKGYSLLSTLGGEQSMSMITESGLYHCILRSRRPEAKAFRRWVTGELLPTLRKNGEYTKDDRFVVL
jgi:prophage antirepressor-like protein